MVTHPLYPPPLIREGEGLVLKGFHPFNLPRLTKERGIYSRRGADAPLKHPTFLTQSKESLREAKPIDMFL